MANKEKIDKYKAVHVRGGIPMDSKSVYLCGEFHDYITSIQTKSQISVIIRNRTQKKA